MKKKYTRFRPKIRSRHPSHEPFRDSLPLLPFRSVVRLGSTTELHDRFTERGDRIECNSAEAIANSSNKLLMKQCFDENEVKTADWIVVRPDGFGNPTWCHFYPDAENRYDDNYGYYEYDGNIYDEGNCPLEYPIVAKHIYGSRGRGNTLINSREELERWMRGKTLRNYIFEKFYNYNREYRLHVTEDGCFYTCRKMLRNETPENQRWYRNDNNSVWIVEDNPQFNRPSNWDVVVEESVKALKAVGLDVGAVDLRIQSENNNRGNRRENPDFIILEINSAPSMGMITLDRYIEKLPEILMKKYNR